MSYTVYNRKIFIYIMHYHIIDACNTSSDNRTLAMSFVSYMHCTKYNIVQFNVFYTAHHRKYLYTLHIIIS